MEFLCDSSLTSGSSCTLNSPEFEGDYWKYVMQPFADLGAIVGVVLCPLLVVRSGRFNPYMSGSDLIMAINTVHNEVVLIKCIFRVVRCKNCRKHEVSVNGCIFFSFVAPNSVHELWLSVLLPAVCRNRNLLSFLICRF